MSDPAPEQRMGKDIPETADIRTVLDEAVSHYETSLLRYVGQLLRNGAAHEAEDVVQETFLRYYREVSRDRESVRNTSTWLFRVAHNLAMDTLRRQVRHSRHEARLGENASPAPADTLEEIINSESGAQAMAELRRLPEELRQVLLLRVVHGMKLREISEVTGLTIGNAGYRISHALQELTKRLKERGVI